MRTKVFCLTLITIAVCSSGFAYQTKSSQNSLPPAIQEVIRRFTAAETENKIARNNYTFTQEIDLLTIGEAGSITGRFHRISDIVYDDRGTRVEKITFFPPPTAQVNLTQEDMQDFAGVQPFALTSEDLPKYNVEYVGKDKIDELNTYIFDVKPKTIIKGQRYLEGRLWVDDQDLQIVKVKGQALPQFDDNKFPHFESYRENIDGHYWFPTYVYSDDVLEFKKSGSIHLRATISYTKYKKFSGRIRVGDEGEAASEDEVKGAVKNKPPVKPPDQDPSKPDLKRPKKP
jgi:hypothetical protein